MKIRTIKQLTRVVWIIVFVALSGITLRQYLVYTQAQQTLAENRTALEQTQSEIAMIQQQLDRFSKEREEFSRYLFAERDIPSFLDRISEYAQKTGIDILDMKTRDFAMVSVSAGDNIARRQKILTKNAASENQGLSDQEKAKQVFTLAALPIDIKVKGSFADLAQFLQKLQESQQLVNVSNIEIGRGTRYPRLECAFKLSIYSLKTLQELTR